MSIMSLFFSYRGRINRARFWLGVLILLPVTFAIAFLVIDGGQYLDESFGFSSPNSEERGPIVEGLAVMAMAFIIYLHFAVYVKRLHDRGRSGWLVLFSFVPVIGLIWVLIELGMRPGDPGPNAYGAPP